MKPTILPVSHPPFFLLSMPLLSNGSRRDGSNQVGGTKECGVDRNGDRPGRMFKAIIVEPTELQPLRSVY